MVRLADVYEREVLKTAGLVEENEALRASVEAEKERNAKMEAELDRVRTQVGEQNAENAKKFAELQAQLAEETGKKADLTGQLAQMGRTHKAEVKRLRDSRAEVAKRAHQSVVDAYAGLIERIKTFRSQRPEVERINETIAHVEGTRDAIRMFQARGYDFPEETVKEVDNELREWEEKAANFDEVTLSTPEFEAPMLSLEYPRDNPAVRLLGDERGSNVPVITPGLVETLRSEILLEKGEAAVVDVPGQRDVDPPVEHEPL